MAQLMPLPLTVSCFSKIQIGFTFLILAHLGSPEKGPLNGCVCVCVRVRDRALRIANLWIVELFIHQLDGETQLVSRKC